MHTFEDVYQLKFVPADPSFDPTQAVGGQVNSITTVSVRAVGEPQGNEQGYLGDDSTLEARLCLDPAGELPRVVSVMWPGHDMLINSSRVSVYPAA